MTGNYTTYSASDMCTSPANDTGFIFPGIFNQVLVDSLAPSTKYFYVVGDDVRPFFLLYPSSFNFQECVKFKQAVGDLAPQRFGPSCLIQQKRICVEAF